MLAPPNLIRGKRFARYLLLDTFCRKRKLRYCDVLPGRFQKVFNRGFSIAVAKRPATCGATKDAPEAVIVPSAALLSTAA